MQRYNAATEAPPIKVEGFGGLERLRRTVGPFPTVRGGVKTHPNITSFSRTLWVTHNSPPPDHLHAQI